MTGQLLDLDEERLKKCLEKIYRIQTRNCLPDEVMPLAMKELGLDEKGAIELIKEFIRLGWLSTGNIKEKFFLRPGYVTSFPVIVSTCGIQKIKG